MFLFRALCYQSRWQDTMVRFFIILTFAWFAVLTLEERENLSTVSRDIGIRIGGSQYDKMVYWLDSVCLN